MAIKEIDCLYEVCPIPLLKTMKEMKNMQVGDIVIIKANNSCVCENIGEWADKNNYEYEIVELDNLDIEIYIKKTR